MDTFASLEHCGACGVACGNGQVCINGSCSLLPEDCTNAACGSGYSCDPLTLKCVRGCRLSSDCPSGATCNNGSCGCQGYQHICGQTCVSNANVTSCGFSACSLCETPANAAPTCDALSCGFACLPGFRQQGQSCVDIDECATGNGGCAANATCENTPGNRACTCRAGYFGNGTSCTDVDECATNNGGCASNASCTNTPGSRTCQCPVGFTGSGVTCTDVNECLTGNGGCSLDAQCTNTPGSRTCQCLSGYTGNGLTCVLTDVCATNNGGCVQGATCTNVLGGRTCTCPQGFSGDGITACTDINECATNNGGCSADAQCTNAPGTRNCACRAGWYGNGVVCTQARAVAVLRMHGVTTDATEGSIETYHLATGVLLSSVALPSTASGGNGPITFNGASLVEGALNLSVDGTALVLGGYSASLGRANVTNTSSATVPRVVARVLLNGNVVNTTTVITDAYSNGSIRGVASLDGTGYWLAGTPSGLRWAVQGTLGTSAPVYNQVTNLRTVSVVGGGLYATTGSNLNPDGGTEFSPVFGIGSGLPTTLTTNRTNLPGVLVNNPTSFALLDRSAIITGFDTLYVVDSGANVGVRRFEFDGASWRQTGTFSGTAYFLSAFASQGVVVLVATGPNGVTRWDDTGFVGAAPPGNLVVSSPGADLRGVVLLP